MTLKSLILTLNVLIFFQTTSGGFSFELLRKKSITSCHSIKKKVITALIFLIALLLAYTTRGSQLVAKGKQVLKTQKPAIKSTFPPFARSCTISTNQTDHKKCFFSPFIEHRSPIAFPSSSYSRKRCNVDVDLETYIQDLTQFMHILKQKALRNAMHLIKKSPPPTQNLNIPTLHVFKGTLLDKVPFLAGLARNEHGKPIKNTDGTWRKLIIESKDETVPQTFPKELVKLIAEFTQLSQAVHTVCNPYLYSHPAILNGHPKRYENLAHGTCDEHLRIRQDTEICMHFHSKNPQLEISFSCKPSSKQHFRKKGCFIINTTTFAQERAIFDGHIYRIINKPNPYDTISPLFSLQIIIAPPIDSLPFKEEQTDLSKQLSYISRTGAPQYKRYYNSEWPLEYAYFNWSEQARSPSLATNPDRSIPMTNFNYGIQRELQDGSIIWFVPEVDPTDCMQGNKLALYKSDPLPKQPSKDLHNESWQQGFKTIKSDGRGRIFELIQVITSDKPIYSVAVAQSPVIVEDKEGKQVYPQVIGDKEEKRIGHLRQSLEVKTNYANLTARLAHNNELPTQIPMFAISHSAAHTNRWATLFHPVEDQPEILLHKTSSSTLTYPHRHSVEQWQQFLYHSASKSTSLKFLAGVTSLGAFIFKQRLLGSGSANPQTSTVPTP